MRFGWGKGPGQPATLGVGQPVGWRQVQQFRDAVAVEFAFASQVLGQRLAAHEGHDWPRRVVGTGCLAQVDLWILLALQHQALKDLAQHFRVNGYFLIKRTILADRKVIALQQVSEEVTKGGVAYRQACLGG